MSKEKIKVEKPLNEQNNQEGKVGTILQDVRTKKKKTIEQVAEDLRIKVSYLTAIENSDYNNIPSVPYSTGFVRSYASYLGLNSEQIVQLFKEEISPSSQEKASIITPDSSEEIIVETETMSPNHKYILLSAILLVLCYFLWLFLLPSNSVNDTTENKIASTSQSENDYPLQVEDYTEENAKNIDAKETPEFEQITITDAVFEETEEDKTAEVSDNKKPEEKTSEKKVQEEKIVETPQPSKTETETEKAENTNQTNVSTPKKSGRVVLKIKKETWVEVKDENKLWISKVLHAGDEYVLPENGVGKTVSFGNTDGVDVLIDGKAVTVISNNKKTNINMDAFLGNH